MVAIAHRNALTFIRACDCSGTGDGFGAVYLHFVLGKGMS